MYRVKLWQCLKEEKLDLNSICEFDSTNRGASRHGVSLLAPVDRLILRSTCLKAAWDHSGLHLFPFLPFGTIGVIEPYKDAGKATYMIPAGSREERRLECG